MANDTTLNLQNINLTDFNAPEQALPATMSEALKENPDQFSNELRMAEDTGLSQSAVAGNPEEVENSLKLNQIDFATMSQRSPNTSKFLTDFNNAVVAQDDIPVLERLEGIVRGFGQGIVQQGGMGAEGLGKALEIPGRTTERLLGQEDVGSFQLVPFLLKFYGSEITEFSEEIGPDVEDRNFGTDVATGVGQAVGQIATFLVAPEVAGISLFGQGVEQQSLRQEETGTAESTFLADVALLAGGTATAVTEKFGIDRILNRIPPNVKNKIARTVADIAIGGGTEAVQEVTEGIAQSIIEQHTTNPDAPLLEGLANEAAVAGTVGAILRSIVLTATPGKARGVDARAGDTEGQSALEQQQLDELNKNSTESKLRERNPESFHQLIKENGGENDTHVYINSEAVATYLEGQDIASDGALILLSDRVAEAQSLGIDVSIPVADFATVIAGTPHFDALRDNMTLSDSTVSPAQQEQVKAETEQYVQNLVAEAQENVSEYVEAQDIFNTVREQLIDSGQVNPQNATVMAQLVPAWATVFARNNGISIEEAFEQSGLVIEGPQTGKAEETGFLQRVKDLVTGKSSEEVVFDQDQGSITRGYYDPANTVIRLTEASNMSTFLHEFAHFMYEMEITSGSKNIEDINKWFTSNAEAIAVEAEVSVDDITAYLENNTTGDETKDISLRRATHEQLARGFEQYLLEGKAPSVELRNVFRTFARWLAEIYGQLRGSLNVNLTDEMRQVFDRMLATENQLDAARARERYQPMFTDAEMAGMTEKQFADYKERQSKAEGKESETLRDKLIKQLTRQTKTWWKEEKADMVVEETNRLNNEKVYLAINALKGEEIKLDHATVKELIGEDRVDKRGIKSRRINEKLNGMTAKGGTGVHPDQAAAFLGYNSGDEMIADIIAAPPIKVAADVAAQARMIQKHGDILSDGTIEQQAEEALQNEDRGKLLLAELKKLAKGTGISVVDRATIKAVAEASIAKLSFRQIQPGKYRKAEIAAAQESAVEFAAGNMEEATRAKTRQVMNFYLGMAATNARNDITNIVDRMARYNKKSVREEIMKSENGYWEQIVNILQRFEFRKSATLQSVSQQNESLNNWAADRIEIDGDALILSSEVLNENYQTHWKNVPFNTLQGVNDSVKNIEHVARYANKMNKAGEEIEFKKLVQDWTDSMNNKVETKFKPQRTDVAEGKKWGRWAMAQMTKIPYLASWLDGGERVGISHDLLVQPFTDALNDEIVTWNEVGQVVMNAIQERDKATVKRHNTKIFIPEIKDANNDGNLMGHQILAVALNTGNESNLRKMLLGEGWMTVEDDVSLDNPQLQAVLAHMTESDWNMVQMIWDQMNVLYPRLADVHRKTTGLTPPKVEASPVPTPFGTFNGGYYPVKYDSNRSQAARQNEERTAAQVDSMFSTIGSIQSSVNASATNERTGFYAPIRLSLDVVPNHFQETIHFITHHDAVRQVNKLIRDKQVAKTISEKLGKEEFAQLNPWLNDIAKDGKEAPNKSFIDDIFGKLRFGLTLGIMGFKASTGIIQLSGLSNSIAELGLKPIMQSMRTILGSPKTIREAWDFASSNSKVLNHRTQTMDREIKSALNKLSGKRGFIATIQEASMKHIAYVQTYMVDLPTWYAAYIKELGESGDEQKAYRRADWTIENIQGSGATKDMASIMRNQSNTHRMFTMFMTFFSSLWNQTRELGRGQSATTIAAKSMFLFTIPVLFEMLMRGEFGGEDEPEEDLQEMLTKVALFPVQSIPFLRDAASAISGEYGYNITPVASVLEQGITAIPAIAENMMTDDEVTKAQVKGASKLVGAGLGIPGVNQAWATGEHLYDVIEEGEDLTVRQLLFGPDRE